MRTAECPLERKFEGCSPFFFPNWSVFFERILDQGRDNFRKGYLEPSMLGGYVAQLYPDSTKRRDQAYYLTQKGLVAEITDAVMHEVQ